MTPIQSVCRRLRLGEAELRRPDRGRRPAEARHRIGYIAKELSGLTYGSVAQRFGREAISFSIGVRRLAERLEQDAELKREMENLCREIRKDKKRKY